MQYIAIFVALALSALTAVYLFQEEEEAAQPEVVERVIEKVEVVEKEVPTVEILVARNYIPIGTRLESYHLDRQPWPSTLVLDDFIVSSDAAEMEILKMITRAPFQEREPVIRSKLANPDDPSFLAGALPKGNRAITLPVSDVSAVAGFIFPGDRVDIIITHGVEMGTEDPNNPDSPPLIEQISEVLVPNVLVLAVDQRATAASQEEPMPPNTVTVMVDQNDAQRIAQALAEGVRLTLVLRSLADRDEIVIPKPVTTVDLSRVTPPSYFPVLYDASSSYTPRTINMFEGLDAAQSAESGEDFDIAEYRKRLATGGSGGKSALGTVVVVRGIEKETVGVDLP